MRRDFFTLLHYQDWGCSFSILAWANCLSVLTAMITGNGRECSILPDGVK